MSDDAAPTRCPACGQDNRCGMKAAGECWCATGFPLRMPLALRADAACYCRNCLRRLIESLPADERSA